MTAATTSREHVTIPVISIYIYFQSECRQKPADLDLQWFWNRINSVPAGQGLITNSYFYSKQQRVKYKSSPMLWYLPQTRVPCVFLNLQTSVQISLSLRILVSLWIIFTPDRRQLKTPILSRNVDQKSIKTVFSKTLFLSNFDPRSSIVDNVFDCRLLGVILSIGELYHKWSFWAFFHKKTCLMGLQPGRAWSLGLRA